MVPLSGPIAHVDGVFNAVVVEGDQVGPTTYVGRGAGGGPTASAVIADAVPGLYFYDNDVIDIARGARLPVFNLPADALADLPSAPIERRHGAYYIRLMVVDRPGVIADVAAILRDEKISVESLLQRGRDPGETVPVVLTTHETEEKSMQATLARMGRLEAVAEPPQVIRIEDL